MNPSDPWERLLVAGLARDFQQMRLRVPARPRRGASGAKDDPAALIAALGGRARAGDPPVPRDDRPRAGRHPLAPAMLAQIASQARNLLHR